MLVLLAGCASLPQDRGFADVRRLVADRGGHELIEQPDAATRNLVAELLKKELTPDDAVRIALMQNPLLRAKYAQLGFAAADVYQAGRLSNPRLSASIVFSNRAGDASQAGFGLVQSFTDLLLLPARSRFARGEFERTKQLVGSAALDLSAEVEASYYRTLGAAQSATMRQTILTAAQASAELAQRFFDAGNITRLALAMEQAAATQAQLECLNADREATAARSELNSLLGLRASEDQWTLPASLSAPLPNEDEPETLVALAEQSRLDLAAARNEADLLAGALGITRRYRYVGSIDVGVETERETDRSHITGPTLGLELPIFNQGADRVARAQAQLQQAESAVQSLEIEVSNAVKLAHARVLSAKSRAEQYRTALIPQREEIVRRTLEQVNYMLKGQFELLLAKQQEYDAYQGYLGAVRDYWIARVELAHAVGTRLPSSSQTSSETVAPIVPQEPPASMHMHRGSGMQDMPGMEGMEGMDHSQHKPASKKKSAPASEHQHHPGDTP